MRLLTKGNRRPGRDRSPTMNNVIRQKKPRRDKNDDRRKRLFFLLFGFGRNSGRRSSRTVLVFQVMSSLK